MPTTFRYILKAVILLPFIFGVDSTIEPLKCYQCEVKELHLCTDEYLLPCPNTQAYDSCLTRIFKTKSDGEWIHKNCALAPCSLRDESQSTGLGLDHCDRSQNEYDCISCCKGDGCNTGTGTAFQPAFVLLITSLVVLTAIKKCFSK